MNSGMIASTSRAVAGACDRWSRRFTIQAGVLLLILGTSALPAAAQMMGGSELEDVGNTRLQKAVGRAVTAVCNDLSGTNPSGGSADLLVRCIELVDSAIEIAGGSAGQSLGLTESELNEAVDDIAHRQLPATAKSSSEISSVHTATVSQRLYALRQGTEQIMIAGLLRDSEGNTLPVDYRWSPEDSAAGIKEKFPPGLGLYLNGMGSFGHRDSDNEELGFDYRNLGFTLGGDYRLSDSTVTGGAFSYVNTFQDFNRDKGEIDVNNVAFSAYGAHRFEAFYVDGILTYAHNEIDLEREIRYATIARTAKGDTSSDEFSIAIGSGYEFETAGFTYGPMMDWEWIWLDIRSFTESSAGGLNLKHSHDSMKSATVDLGVEGSYPISTRYGVFIPQLSVAWAHQFEDDTREIKARYEFDTGLDEGEFFVETDSPDRNYAKLSAAVSASLQGGWSAFGSYQAIVGHNRLSYHGFNFGGRYSF